MRMRRIPSSSSCTTDENAFVVGRAHDGDDRHPRSRASAGSSRATRREDQPVDAARPHGLDDALLAPRVAVGVGEDRDIAVRREPVLDAADDRRKGRIGDVRHDHADRARAQRAQRRGGGIRQVFQPLARLADLLAQRAGDAMARIRIERARHRRDIDADRAGDVLQCRARRHAVASLTSRPSRTGWISSPVFSSGGQTTICLLMSLNCAMSLPLTFWNWV